MWARCSVRSSIRRLGVSPHLSFLCGGFHPAAACLFLCPRRRRILHLPVTNSISSSHVDTYRFCVLLLYVYHSLSHFLSENFTPVDSLCRTSLCGWYR